MASGTLPEGSITSGASSSLLHPVNTTMADSNKKDKTGNFFIDNSSLVLHCKNKYRT